MAGRRHRSRRNWPDHLLAREKAKGLYYYWRDPRTGKEYGLGYDFADAASQVREANAVALATRSPKASLVDRLSGADVHTVGAWLDRFDAVLTRRPGKRNAPRSYNTLKTDRSRLKVLREHFGDTLIANVTTRQCSDLIEKTLEAGKQRLAQSIRSFMIDCFNEAEAAGWISLGQNPAKVTRAPTPQVKRSRLSLDQYKAILALVDSPWAKHGMQLALLTGQRIGDICQMKFSDIREGYLHIVQDKEGHPIRVPLAIRLPALDLSLGQVIDQIRALGFVEATHLIHHVSARTLSKPGDRVHEHALSKAFTRAVRKLDNETAMAFWEGKDPPTFHEIRSLAKRLYDEIGVNTMDLLGHKSEEMSALYGDMRGEWVTVKLPAE
ncbi:tyrosine-type recombinase/integrase [Amantichitinum ursilacus]|uniref:Phage integrase family protein n=1 Tax=Amantichitinum ursilacus TaxID=857265 RepID=A0A0N0GNR2_9NEIS|nr:tyrosine-type recombinase/integrase [Amantichitinum ursilacus]KPC52995.1 hypothetical protein WG78_10910 [Amantichitinum ursilacus]